MSLNTQSLQPIINFIWTAFLKNEGLLPLSEIAADILKLEQETDGLLKEIIA